MGVRRTISRGLRFLAAFVIVAIISPIAAAGVLLATNLFLPLPAKIPEPKPLEAIQFSRVYDVNGDLIHVYKQFDQNIPVEPSDIPDVVKNAVIAAEDHNFYSHSGFDVRGTIRALVTDVRQGQIAEGGSTITQQLARNAYGVGKQRSIGRKIREAILASQIDRSLTKEQILYQYLSVAYFGEGAYGIGAAAETYFKKRVNDLDLSEAATLAGLIPAPSRFNPRADPGTAEIRRRSVLDHMLDQHLITVDEWNSVKDRTIWLASNGPPPGPDPVTTVQPPTTDPVRYPYFIQYLTDYLVNALGSEDLLYRGGLQIYTTLDPAVQHEAEATVAETLDGIDPRTSTDPATGADVVHTMQMSITAVEPPTGFVRAMVGGRDFQFDQTNLATGAGTFEGRGRQPGSSFKPIVLAEAFEQGITPDAVYSGGPLTIGDYSPENYGGATYGKMTLRTATEKSVNTVFVRLMQDVGPYEVVDLAKRLGLNIRDIDPKVDGSGLSIALGSARGDHVGHGLGLRHLRQQRCAGRPHPGRPRGGPGRNGAPRSIGTRWTDRAPAGHRRQRDRRAAGRADVGDRGRQGHRPTGRGQDRNDAGQQGRLVRRLHPDAVHRGVHGVRPPATVGPGLHGQGPPPHRWVVPGQRVAAVHEGGGEERPRHRLQRTGSDSQAGDRGSPARTARVLPGDAVHPAGYGRRRSLRDQRRGTGRARADHHDQHNVDDVDHLDHEHHPTWRPLRSLSPVPATR